MVIFVEPNIFIMSYKKLYPPKDWVEKSKKLREKPKTDKEKIKELENKVRKLEKLLKNKNNSFI